MDPQTTDTGARETLLVDGKPHEIETRPVTLLCHPGTVNLAAPARLEINARITLEYAEMMSQQALDLFLEAGLDEHFRSLFGDHPVPRSSAALRHEGTGVKHAVGLIGLLMFCVGVGIPPYVRCPESFLHPRAQAGLGDVIVALSLAKGTAHERAEQAHKLATLGTKMLALSGMNRPAPA